jgi:hypothetical protein
MIFSELQRRPKRAKGWADGKPCFEKSKDNRLHPFRIFPFLFFQLFAPETRDFQEPGTGVDPCGDRWSFAALHGYLSGPRFAVETAGEWKSSTEPAGAKELPGHLRDPGLRAGLPVPLGIWKIQPLHLCGRLPHAGIPETLQKPFFFFPRSGYFCGRSPWPCTSLWP